MYPPRQEPSRARAAILVAAFVDNPHAGGPSDQRSAPNLPASSTCGGNSKAHVELRARNDEDYMNPDVPYLAVGENRGFAGDEWR